MDTGKHAVFRGPNGRRARGRTETLAGNWATEASMQGWFYMAEECALLTVIPNNNEGMPDFFSMESIANF